MLYKCVSICVHIPVYVYINIRGGIHSCITSVRIKVFIVIPIRICMNNQCILLSAQTPVMHICIINIPCSRMCNNHEDTCVTGMCMLKLV